MVCLLGILQQLFMLLTSLCRLKQPSRWTGSGECAIKIVGDRALIIICREDGMKITSVGGLIVFLCLSVIVGTSAPAQSKLLSAYISDSPSSSVPAWIAKEAGLFKKYGLDIDLVFIDGSTRGIQSLLAGDLSFTEAVGTSAINGRIAGGDIAIVNGVVNTLPYYVVGKANIKSREELKGRTAAVHIPGTAADFALRLALKQVGISYNQIKAITVGGGPARIASVIAGQTDFTIVSDAEKIQGERKRTEGRYRHGSAQSSVSLYLHGYEQADDSRATQRGPEYGRGDCSGGSLLQNEQGRIHQNNEQIHPWA